MPDLPQGYCVPSHDQVVNLRIESYTLIGVFMITIGLVLHNIIMYLWIQRKYRVLQISVFYFFALLVLVFRIC